jgi:hypothetical protein
MACVGSYYFNILKRVRIFLNPWSEISVYKEKNKYLFILKSKSSENRLGGVGHPWEFRKRSITSCHILLLLGRQILTPVAEI